MLSAQVPVHTRAEALKYLISVQFCPIQCGAAGCPFEIAAAHRKGVSHATRSGASHKTFGVISKSCEERQKNGELGAITSRSEVRPQWVPLFRSFLLDALSPDTQGVPRMQLHDVASRAKHASHKPDYSSFQTDQALQVACKSKLPGLH